MKGLLTPIIVSVVFLLLGWYSYQALKTTAQDFNPILKNILCYGYILGQLVLIGWFWIVMSRMGQTPANNNWMYFMAFAVLVLVPQIVMILPIVLEDIYRLGRSLILVVSKLFTNEPIEADLASRRKFISQVAVGAAAIPFLGILYGITKGKYNYKVKRETLVYDDLPASFDGLVICQISDIHVGSFDNPEKVAYAVDLINAQGADVILFTGDMVNNKASELDNWEEIIGKMDAPMGKFSVLGNHDYGDYEKWPNEAAKFENLEDLKRRQKSMGFNLLLNENHKLTRGEDSISLVGVENWGLPPFVQYGKLDKALEGAEPFKVLLSHDPSHFDAEVVPHKEKVHLTLAGHTHGMQFGIEIPGIRWSPVKYKYPKWAGLYEKKDQYLYVNRGFGYLAFPGRVGIWPEITLLELKKA